MDWKQLINEITESGLRQSEIAAKAGLVQSAISDLVTGKTKEPRFTAGKKLMALHKEAMKRKRKLEA